MHRIHWHSFVLLAACLGMTAWTSTATAADPRLTQIFPRGGQRGTEVEVTFSGARLADAEEIFYYSPGFETVSLEQKNANQALAKIKIAPDCRLGEHVMQVRTKTGISDFRTFFVGALPETKEQEPNNDFTAPQPIPLNTTVVGIVQNEDVDYFIVEAKQGQRLCAEVEAMRLATTLFDPHVAILNRDRFELAADDDTTLVKQDAVASLVVPEDGSYIIAVRESSYGGNGNCRYRLHVGDFPRPTAVFPAGGPAGATTEVRYLGDPSGEMTAAVAIPADAPADFGVFAQDAGGIAPSPNAFRVFPHGNAVETEPNNGIGDATKVDLPNAFNGIIAEPGDVDCFRFTAKKGQNFEVECYARRIRSPLDPVMHIYYGNGKYITSNDDSRGPDSYFRFNVPADGEYVIRVTDHLGRGGADFVFRLEFLPVTPSLNVTIPRVSRYGQEMQQIFVPRGGRFATRVNLARRNFGGDLVLEAPDLPAGITMIAPPIKSNMSTVPVVFEAAADAPLSGKLIKFTARHADANQKIQGNFSNQADFVIGGPGQSKYVVKDVVGLPVAVIEEAPFSLEIAQPKVPIVQNGSMQLKIVATRKEGYDKPIRVQLPFRPPGVGTTSAITIPAGKTEGLYPLNANSKAAVGDWPIYVIGSADNGGNTWVSSQMATLTIAPPYISVAAQRVATEQGQPVEMLLTITQNTPFEGVAKLQIYGLPNKAATVPLEFNKDTKELIANITTDPATPAGRHKNVFSQVTITQDGEPIVHRTGGTELRVDKPLPKPKAEPAKPKPQPKPAAKPAAKPPKKKPLSRLEQLRLKAKEAREQTNK